MSRETEQSPQISPADNQPAFDPARPEGGFADQVGYEIESWSEDRAVVVMAVSEKHLNRSGVMHGGVLATLIDAACGFAGCYSPDPATPRRALTLMLNTQFIAAGREGQRLRAVATRTGGGRSVFFATCEVCDEDGKVLGRGDGVFKYRRS